MHHLLRAHATLGALHAHATLSCWALRTLSAMLIELCLNIRSLLRKQECQHSAAAKRVMAHLCGVLLQPAPLHTAKALAAQSLLTPACNSARHKALWQQWYDTVPVWMTEETGTVLTDL